MSVEGHTDSVDEDLVDPGDPLINGVITELSGTDGEKSTDSSQHARLLGELIVDDWGDWSQSVKPGSLNVVHMM